MYLTLTCTLNVIDQSYSFLSIIFIFEGTELYEKAGDREKKEQARHVGIGNMVLSFLELAAWHNASLSQEVEKTFLQK